MLPFGVHKSINRLLGAATFIGLCMAWWPGQVSGQNVADSVDRPGAKLTTEAESPDEPRAVSQESAESPAKVPEDVMKLRAMIESLIPQLGSAQFDTRERAMRELRATGSLARSALEKAITDNDAEIATRARILLAGLPKATYFLVDAVNRPIPFAKVIFRKTAKDMPGSDAADASGHPHTSEDWADEQGRIGIPGFDAQPIANTPPQGGQPFGIAKTYVTVVEIHHPDYGWGQYQLTQADRQKQLRLPLVRQGTELHDRAVTGVVVAPDGLPVVRAVVSCNSVRTLGEGLIEAAFPLGDALTDDAGRFRYYLPNHNRNRSRGELIPPNSRYQLRIALPDDDAYFPVEEYFANTLPVRVTMPRPIQRHRFRFQLLGDNWLDQPEQLRNLWVKLERRADDRPSVRLDATSLIRGRSMLPGTYSAVSYDNGKPVHFEPLVISPDSPEELIFQLPKPMTYRGQVVHGVTREPVRNAFVFGWNSTSRNNLALLSDDDWALLEETPSNPAAEHPAMKLLAKFYGVKGLVRTDAEGRFEITRQPDQEFYGLLAFDRSSIPFQVHGGSLKPDGQRRIDAGGFPLFPAARVVVRPVFEAKGKNLSVMPEWVTAEESQPEWFPQFRNIQRYSGREFSIGNWLTLNEPQPIYVPAGIRLKLRFDVPYNDEWAPAVLDKSLQLEPGAKIDAGDIHFTASLPAEVLVVDSAGNPVEGFAVRRKYDRENSWCVAHNTDKDGKAFFHVQPNSNGLFRVGDLHGPQELAGSLSVRFSVGETAPPEPFRIVVTGKPAALLRAAK